MSVTMKQVQFVSVVVVVMFFNHVACGGTGNETDKFALLAFKAGITDDPWGVLSSWNHTTHFCEWYGVRCSPRHRHRVVELELMSQRLSGYISPHVGNLSFLRRLSLYDNRFGHEIPPQIGRLWRLRILELSLNSLSGEIPKNISGCHEIRGIGLHSNLLTGEIFPREFNLLLKLQMLVLAKNSLTGSVPSSIANLSSLEQLYLSGNNLAGSIPQALGQLTKLQELSLGQCGFSGTIPQSLFNLSSLTLFEVGLNQVQGSLPANMGFTLPNLEYFSIESNLFSGTIPESISNLTSLQVLQLGGNHLYGNMPSLENLHNLQRLLISFNRLGSGGSNDLSFLCSLTNATSLIHLAISGNTFGGSLPVCIGNYSTTLEALKVEQNMISGIIPRAVGNLLNLEWLQMNDNYLSGTLPEGIGNLQNLTYLYLSDNDLHGVIPSSLQNLTNLNMLFLDGNNFQGHIPSQLGSLQSLQWLGISNNNLNGSIFLEVPSLIYLNLSNNYLTGVVPMEVGDLKKLNYLDFSGNLLHGEIPSSIGNCSSLTMLMMQDNLFQGLIPQSLSSARGIEVLDLSKNNLSGEIPKFLGDFLSLQLLNLSYNNFEGMLPTGGIFKNVTDTIIIGNKKLCGGIPEFHLPMCPTVNFKGKGRTQESTLSISIISGLIGVALIIVFLFLYVSKKKKKPGPSSTDNQWQNLSYGTLLKATDGFSPSHLIGIGSFGSVYKGIVHENGTIVAVKVLNVKLQGAMKSFISECEALKNIKHRNLLKVLTVCSGIDYKGDEFKALVYEFMVNGSLELWLHPNQVPADASNGSPKILTLVERMNISIHVASALDYLHNHCHNPVIHCDLKPSNVLLDADMVGHVGDFGLAKIILESNSSAGAELSSAGIRGTVGYAPPEYGVESVVSREGDVYSYGILLLEVFTGVTPVNEMFEDNSNLHNFVKEALPERVLEITDPILLQEREIFRDPTRENIVRECLVMVYELGIACSVEVPRERMSIVDVTTRLCSIKDRLYAAGLRG